MVLERASTSFGIVSPKGDLYLHPFLLLLLACLVGPKNASRQKSTEGNIGVTQKTHLSRETAPGCEGFGAENRSRPVDRWISRDPIEERGGNNLYGYVLNNPGRFGDPLGLQLEEPPPEPEPDPFEPPGFEDPSEEDPNGEGQSGALPSPEEDPPSGEDSENKPPPSGNGGGGNCPSDATSNSNKSSRPTSAGKMNKDNSRGRGPRGFKSFHGPKSNVPGSKPHVHYDNGTSHNSDGTPHDPGRGTPNPTNAQRDYLNKNGWKPPK